MTREEAIKVLQREKDYVQQAIQSATEGSGYVSPDGLIRAEDYVEASTMAISALRAQKSSCCKKCNDLYDEDGGDIYSPQKERNDPLTLDDLRGNCRGCVNEEHKEMCIGCIRHSLKFNGDLYRQKPEEVQK